MKVEKVFGRGVSAYDINLTVSEMRTISETGMKLSGILATHKKEDVKPEYPDDELLSKIVVILGTICRQAEFESDNEFDKHNVEEFLPC
jgi:hypothetical protein